MVALHQIPPFTNIKSSKHFYFPAERIYKSLISRIGSFGLCVPVHHSRNVTPRPCWWYFHIRGLLNWIELCFRCLQQSNCFTDQDTLKFKKVTCVWSPWYCQNDDRSPGSLFLLTPEYTMKTDFKNTVSVCYHCVTNHLKSQYLRIIYSHQFVGWLGFLSCRSVGLLYWSLSLLGS